LKAFANFASIIVEIMIVHTGFKNLKLTHPVVTLGIFDGVHRGHKALLDYLVQCAKNVNGDSVVVTFNPHPRLLLSEKPKGFSYLTSLDEKKRLLEEAGIDNLIVIRFTKILSEMSAYDFVRKILVQKIGTEHLIVGYDHHFGKMREGNYDSVKECAKRFDFRVEQIKEVISDEEIISSTSIRDALLAGNPDIANKLLGYSYSIKGTIIRGKGIGRKIGFPTANIKPSDKYKLIPSNGVYAVMVRLDDRSFMGMLSIGYNPTVNKNPSKRSIEVNIFNFQDDIYGRGVKVFFMHRLRDEKRFESISDLTDQMKLDKQLTMKLLS
jgi:riboflavin kinase/FMN adenylyltransferase